MTQRKGPFWGFPIPDVGASSSLFLTMGNKSYLDYQAKIAVIKKILLDHEEILVRDYASYTDAGLHLVAERILERLGEFSACGELVEPECNKK